MTHILNANTAVFIINQDLLRTVPARPSDCVCCLAKNVPFIKLKNCTHNSFFESFKMEYLEALVCLQCHGFLKKFELFRQQVEESQNILKNQSRQRTVNRKFQNLQTSPTKLLSLDQSLPIAKVTTLIPTNDTPALRRRPMRSDFKKEQTNSASTALEQPILVTVKPESTNHTELKTTVSIKKEPVSFDVEIESISGDKDTFSDKKVDVPLLECKKNTTNEKIRIGKYPVLRNKKGVSNKKTLKLPLVKLKKNTTKENKTQVKKTEISKRNKDISDAKKLVDVKFTEVEERYKGIVKLITLTKEELTKEREEDRAKDRYLKLPYKCETCVMGFDHEIVLKNHLSKRHTMKAGSIMCDVCNGVSVNKYAYNEHVKRHYKRYECETCNKRYNSLQAALTHSSALHGNLVTVYQCPECTFTTESDRQFRYHKMKHKQPAQCPHCDKKFITPTGLKAHILIIHRMSDRVYACEACGKQYRHRSVLLAHRASAHAADAPDRPHYCAPCDAHFRTERGLATHLKTNSKHIGDGDKKFVCNECGKRYLLKCKLLEHINCTHLKQHWYACDQCPEKFLRACYMNRHKREVHQRGGAGAPRDKVCHYCGRAFTLNAILEAHIRTHTGERPLQCPECPATFAHKAARYNHVKLVHKRQKITKRQT